MALKCYNPDTPTRDRLLYPQIRVNSELTRVDWDTALEVMAEVSKYVLANYGESAWAMKTFSYEFFENTFAITKLAFSSIQTPAFSPHDKPGPGNDTAGVDDSGIITYSASYQDWKDAEVLFISGTDPFETKTIVFTSWLMNGPKMIMALPRRTAGVAYAEANGGLFLQVIPGHVRFAWVTTWTGAMAASQELERIFRAMTSESPHQITSTGKQSIIETLIERVDDGGMVVVDSDIYPVEPMITEFADIVLPAAAWGEHDAARNNGERRFGLEGPAAGQKRP